MACNHPNGDSVNGYWVCGQCFQKLPSRPVIYVMRPVTTSEDWDVDGRRRRMRQEAIHAPIAKCEGVTLSQFIDMMARRLVARTRGGFHIDDARDYAVECLRSLDETFGSDDMAWDQGAAWDIVDEDMTYWDADEAATN